MKKNNLTTIGSIVTAIGASICCVGPAFLAIVGTGSLGIFGVLEKYRPIFIGLTIILLGLAFYLSYRKHEVNCDDGSCKIESAGKWNKFGVWSALIIAVFAIGYPYLVGKPSPVTNTAFAPKASVILEIEGMTCNGCAVRIQDSISGIAGVHSVTVEYETQNARIVFDSALVMPETLIKHVDETGYSARLSQEKRGK